MTQPSEKSFSIKAGVTVSKRIFKTAVARNLIKRKMREAFRLNKNILTTSLSEINIKLSFMIVYLGKDVVPYEEFESKTKFLLERLVKNIEKENE